ncbi:hypothetical protein PR002_g17059 [Phytophthora rubi]|uniref:Uncharacterized protein n=1 Tax=Phytophthora rubi TaxID=129364 RepID=A0A6A3KF98_9STRA|nr:hypothetical protein PR002_g17059 [Phytophthora rubi]
MPGAERHSGAPKWRACSHRAPKKQTKGDGRAAKGQYGTYSWPMEKLMDHYGNVAAERKLRTPGSKVRAASGSVVAASELEHGKLRLASSKVPASRLVAASELEHGKLRLASSKVRGPASRLVAASELEHGKLRLASSKVRGRWWRAWRWWRR